MMYYSRQYLSAQVETANGKWLVVYLYEAALNDVREASRALKAGDASACGKGLGRALDIIIDLDAALRDETSPELAGRLHGIYHYMIETLALAQKRIDAKALRVCESILATLGAAWRHAAQMNPAAQKRDSGSPRKSEPVALAV